MPPWSNKKSGQAPKLHFSLNSYLIEPGNAAVTPTNSRAQLDLRKAAKQVLNNKWVPFWI